MPRPHKRRWISSWPGAEYFKPRGVPLAGMEVSQLGVDEYEAMRLYDIEGLDQTQGAEAMKVSRATFGRILASAHKKVAEALAFGRAIRIEGGNYQFPPGWGFGPRRGRGRGGGRGYGGGRGGDSRGDRLYL